MFPNNLCLYIKNMCEYDSYDVLKRLSLVLSNLVMLLPLIRIFYESYMISKVVSGPTFLNKSCCEKFCGTLKVVFQKFIVEILIFTSTMVASFLYHMCDDDNPCTQICVTKWKKLYYFDFVFSYQVLNTLIIYFVDRETSWFKILMNILFLGVNAIYVTQYYEQQNPLYDNIYYVGIAIVCIGCIVGKIIYLKCKDRLSHEFTYHFDVIDFIAGIVCMVLGVMFKILGGTEGYYYVYHPLWHTFIMLAIMFCIEIYDKSVSLLCIQRNPERCSCDDY